MSASVMRMSIRARWATRPSGNEAILDECPDRLQAVAPADLLSLVHLTRIVRDRHLVNTDAALANLRRHLGAELEAVRGEANALQDVGTEHLVAGRLVADVGAIEEVLEEGEEARAEVEAPRRARVLLRERPPAVDDLRAPVLDRAQHGEEVLGVVLEVGVLDHDHVAGRVREAGADRRA